jgi:hypothetical protein
MAAFLGMACGKGMLMDGALQRPSLNLSGSLRLGHFSTHRPQPVQSFQFT